MIRKLLAALVLAGAAASVALPAYACGGLVAPDGDIHLSRATTLVAWHNGVERYMTSFTYQGNVSNLGWIVPLPAVPDRIEAGGRWTLQRLFQETHPQLRDAGFVAALSAAPMPAEVLQQVQVEALDITVLRGSGQAVVDWCRKNGFLLPDEVKGHVLAYASGSPIFMAARYNVAAAQARGQLSGDGVPILITMRLPHIWVPLEVLANRDELVQADLYLLTDNQPATTVVGVKRSVSPVGAQLPGAPGFIVQAQEPMSANLYQDLSSDRNMGWVPSSGWLTYLSLDAPGTTVTYDMTVTSMGVMRLAPMGLGPSAFDSGLAGAGKVLAAADGGAAAAATAGLVAILLLVALAGRRAPSSRMSV